jgi:alpha-2-macroglobulin
MCKRNPLRGAAIALGALLLSCLPGGPPRVPAHGTLGPTAGGASSSATAPFAVVFAGPHGVSSLTEPAVTVLFNRAMRDAEAPETAGVPVIHIVTKAGEPVAGTWRFLGTHGVLFAPDRPLPGSTQFAVTVAAGARSLEGEVLRADYPFEFSTPRPVIDAVEPPDGSNDLRPDSALSLQWNQPMAPAEAQRAVHLFARAKPGDKPRAIAFSAAHPAKGKHIDETLVLLPGEKLPADSEIELVLDKGLHGEGPVGTLASHTLSFRTYGPQRLLDVRCPRATGPRCQAHRDLTLVLANAVAPEELKAHFVAPGLPRRKPGPTDPKPKERPKPSREQLVAADPEMGGRYHLRLTKGMRDVFGQTLEKDLTFDVDIEAPFLIAGRPASSADASAPAAPPPETTPDDGNDEEARGGGPGAPDESRPRRARLDYEVKIGLAGHTVEALARQGIKGHKIPIGSVNIPTYGLFAGALAEDDVVQWLGDHRRKRSASAADLRWNWVSPGSQENVRSVRSVDLDTLLAGSGGRGAALLATVLPGSVGSPTTDLVTVTDLAVSAKMSRYGSAVWVTHLSTGAPVVGATVSVLKAGKGELFRATSDADGLAFVPDSAWSPMHEGSIDSAALLVVRSGDDWTWQRVERASASYRSGISLDLAQRGAWAGIVYTDRGVYRPGETMKLAALFRRVDAKGIAIAPGEEVRIAVKDAQDESVFDGRAKLDAFGEAVLDVPIPRTSHLGEARVEAQLGRKGGDSFYAQVQLAAYKASEFKVSVDADKHDYIRGEEARFDVIAEYLFGAPMKDAQLSDHVTRNVTSFTPPHSDGFVTSDEANILDWPETNPKAEELRDKDGKTDDQGRHSLTERLDLPRMRGPENVTLETEVTDLTHQTVARRATVHVHPAAYYLGIERVTPRFVAVGADVRAAVAAIDPQGARVPNAKAHVELVRRTWTGVVLDEGAETPRKRSRVKDDVVAACDVVTTAAAPGACALHVGEPGFYILRARSTDTHGNAVGASESFYALDDRADTKTSPVAWADPDSQGLKLEPDKKKYDAGDVAKILVRNPFKEADAWVTVERAGVLSSRVVTLKGPMPVVEVPIVGEYFPNVFISVHLVRGRVSAPPDSGADVGAPAFRLGVVSVDVNQETHRLKALVTTNKKEYRPGEDVDADVMVSGRDGRAARAAVTFYAVDEGVLMLTSYETPDPLPAFATQRHLAVFDVESRESLAHLLAMKNGDRVRPLGWEYLVNRSNGDKGGEGGGGGEGMRADFKTTAFFDAEQVTTNEGRAHYHFKLPDNLTTFRLMAVVAGEDDRFGSGEATLTTSRKLMARPALPRIVRAGDVFEAGVIVSSRDLPETSADVSIRVKGLELIGPASRRAVVPKGGNVEVRFPVRATAQGDATIELAVAGGGEKDSVLAKRTVVLPVSDEVSSSYGDTTEAAALSLGDLSHLRGDGGGLEVHVASTALVGLATSFDRAIDYPYGCTEQLTSRILPLLVLPEMAKAYGARMPAKIEDKVDDALGELLTHQTGSGGFGFWGDDDAVPWLSAYAMLAVESAAKKGHFVPKSARDFGIDYLRRELDRTSFGEEPDKDSESQGETDTDTDPTVSEPEASRTSPAQKKTHAYATVAFIADVLAVLGQPDPGYLNRLFDARSGRPLFAEAMLLHAMVGAHMPRAEVVVLAKEIEGRLRVDANEAFADEADGTGLSDLLDSSSRTTALVLRALVAVDPAHPLATRLARGLLSRRTNGAWRSTQENVWALLALDDYRQKVESAVPDFDARVFLGGDRLGEVPFHGRSTVDERIFVGAPRLAKASGEAVTFQLLGQGRLFYSAELRYASSELPAKPVDRGLYVQKLVRAVAPEELAKAMETIPKTTDARAPVGHLVLVDLLFESAEPREQVVLSDPLPAGLEPIDFALDTAARTRPVEDEVTAPGDPKKKKALFDYGAFKAAPGMHREQKDDQVLTFLPHVEPGIYHFRYVARATTPGEFVVPPTRAECMYAPEVWGRTAATKFVVGSAQAAPPPVARR